MRLLFLPIPICKSINTCRIRKSMWYAKIAIMRLTIPTHQGCIRKIFSILNACTDFKDSCSNKSKPGMNKNKQKPEIRWAIETHAVKGKWIPRKFKFIGLFIGCFWSLFMKAASQSHTGAQKFPRPVAASLWKREAGMDFRTYSSVTPYACIILV